MEDEKLATDKKTLVLSLDLPLPRNCAMNVNIVSTAVLMSLTCEAVKLAFTSEMGNLLSILY